MKTEFSNFSKFIKKEKLKYHIDISIQTLYSVLNWSTFGIEVKRYEYFLNAL